MEVDFLGFDFKWLGGTNTTSSVHDQISTNPGDDYEDCYDLYDTAGTYFSPRIALTTADLDLRDPENAHVYIKRSGTSTIISYDNTITDFTPETIYSMSKLTFSPTVA